MDELSSRLRAAQRDAVPPGDLWPDVADRIRRRTVNWRHAAAAVLLFGAGVAAGVLAARGNGLPAQTDTAAASPLQAAAAVQSAGSKYVAAVAQLRELGAADQALRMQGYEAALGVLAVTAQEITAELDLREHDRFVSEARSAQAAASQRVTALVGGGVE